MSFFFFFGAPAHRLFEKLVEKDQAFKEATDVATQTFKSHHNGVQRKALVFFGKLVEKGQAFKEATDAATLASNSPDEFVRPRALDLFEKLIETILEDV